MTPVQHLRRAFDSIAVIYKRANASKTVSRGPSSTDYGGMGEREIQLRLELLIDLPNKDLSELFQVAKSLTQFSMADQLRLLEAAQQLSNISTELAHEFCCSAIIALKHLDDKNWHAWVDEIKSLAQHKGMPTALEYLAQTDDYVASLQPEPTTVILEQVRPIIEYLVTGFGRSQLKIAADTELYTDTATLFLPEKYAGFNSIDENFSFYKLATTYLWAQSWFGTWQIDIPQLLYEHNDPEHAIETFQALETLRLAQCLKRTLPGIMRLENALYGALWQPPETSAWHTAKAQLAQEHARAKDSLALIDLVYQGPAPRLYPCHGVFKPGRVYKVLKTRVDDNQKRLAAMLDKLREQLQKQKKIPLKIASPFTLKFYEQALTPDEYNFMLNLNGEDIEIPEDLLELFEQLGQDLGKIPESALATSDSETAAPALSDEVTEAKSHDTAELVLPEWDHAIQKYRKDWCHIHIESSDEGRPRFCAPHGRQALRHHQPFASHF